MTRFPFVVLLAWLSAGAALAHPSTDVPPPPPHERHHPRHGDGEFGPVAVPEGVSVPTWEQLTPAQQAQLAPMKDYWDRMPASRRVHAMERAERRERWESLPPEQRERLRQGARNFRDLPPELRERMRTSIEAMQALPEDERQRLRETWHRMDPDQRRAWLEAGGPGISPPPED